MSDFHPDFSHFDSYQRAERSAALYRLQRFIEEAGYVLKSDESPIAFAEGLIASKTTPIYVCKKLKQLLPRTLKPLEKAQQEFIHAIHHGLVKKMREGRESKIPFDFLDIDHLNALDKAAYCGYTRIISYALSSQKEFFWTEAGITLINDWFHQAIKGGALTLVKRLTDHFPRHLKSVHRGKTPAETLIELLLKPPVIKLGDVRLVLVEYFVALKEMKIGTQKTLIDRLAEIPSEHFADPKLQGMMIRSCLRYFKISRGQYFVLSLMMKPPMNVIPAVLNEFKEEMLEYLLTLPLSFLSKSIKKDDNALSQFICLHRKKGPHFGKTKTHQLIEESIHHTFFSPTYAVATEQEFKDLLSSLNLVPNRFNFRGRESHFISLESTAESFSDSEDFVIAILEGRTDLLPMQLVNLSRKLKESDFLTSCNEAFVVAAGVGNYQAVMFLLTVGLVCVEAESKAAAVAKKEGHQDILVLLQEYQKFMGSCDRPDFLKNSLRKWASLYFGQGEIHISSVLNCFEYYSLDPKTHSSQFLKCVLVSCLRESLFKMRIRCDEDSFELILNKVTQRICYLNSIKATLEMMPVLDSLISDGSKKKKNIFDYQSQFNFIRALINVVISYPLHDLSAAVKYLIRELRPVPNEEQCAWLRELGNGDPVLSSGVRVSEGSVGHFRSAAGASAGSVAGVVRESAMGSRFKY